MATAFWVPPVTPTPAPSPFERSQIRSRDLLYAAAEQVMLMKLQEKEKQSRLPVRGLLATPKKPPPPAMPNVSKIRPTGCFDSPVSIPTLQQLEVHKPSPSTSSVSPRALSLTFVSPRVVRAAKTRAADKTANLGGMGKVQQRS